MFESTLARILMHSAESWILTEKLKSKIQACKMNFLIKIDVNSVTKLGKIKKSNDN